MTQTPYFRSLQDVHAYLLAKGYKATLRTLQNHRKAGKLTATSKGNFGRVTVDRYASEFLPLVETSTPPRVGTLQAEKLEAEARYKRAQAEAAAFDLDVKKGRYILSEDFARELAARGIVADNELTYAFQAHAAEMVSIVNGDPSRTPDLTAYLMEMKESVLNLFSSTREFQVLAESPTKGDTNGK